MKNAKIIYSFAFIISSLGQVYSSNVLSGDDLGETATCSETHNIDLKLYPGLLPKTSMIDVLKACSNRYTLTFKNYQDFCQKRVDDFTSEYLSLDQKTDSNVSSIPFDSMMPFYHDFMDFLSTVKSGSGDTLALIQDITDDLTYYARPRRLTNQHHLTTSILLDSHLRLIASISNPTEEEKTVFWHASNPECLLGLYENDAWKHPLKSLTETDSFDNLGRENSAFYFPNVVSFDLLNKITDLVREKFLGNFHYPMYHQEKLGIPFLTHLAIHRIYPFAFTLNPTGGAHGIKSFSAPAFTTHDFVHGKLDIRVEFLEKHIFKFVDNEFAKRINYDSITTADSLLNAYAPIAIQRLQKIEESFSWFYEKLVTEVLPQRGLGEFKKVMGGFFWVMRESNGFDDEIFSEIGLVDVIEKYVKNSLETLNDKNHSWEVSDNPLNTNPINGLSSLSDAEIIAQILNISGRSVHKSIKAEVIYSPKAENDRAPRYRFIDINFETSCGRKSTVSFPTLYHRVTNIEDARKLLHWSGTRIPAIQDLDALTPEKATAVASDYIDTIRGALEDHINHFNDVFLYYALEERGGNPSAHSRYLEWNLDQLNKLNKELKNNKITTDPEV